MLALGLLTACGLSGSRTHERVQDAAVRAHGHDAGVPANVAPQAVRRRAAQDQDAGEALDASLADAAVFADSGPSDGAGLLTPEQLRDPETCKGCHPAHYREWSSSMHAYAARDPVFIAMNQRGQRETKGALGDFCIRCHAPMAVVGGLTRDGLDLDRLPDRSRGVSCYFCHNVVEIQGDHNGALRLAGDNVMRGPIKDPVKAGVHRSAFTEIFDDNQVQRNAMCGGCHDIVMPSGVHLERTYQEYQHGLYAQRPTADAPALETCSGCHMNVRRDLAAVVPAGIAPRSVHEHLWPGVDVPLTDFPNTRALRAAIEDCQLGIGSVGFFTLEVTPPNVFTFRIETNAGHNMPSGAAQDRRMWLEFLAYDADGTLLDAASSGNIADQEIVDKPADDPNYDPQLWLFSDHIFNEHGEPAHMFWDAAPSSDHPLGYESNTLAVRTQTLAVGTHYVEKVFHASGADGTGTPARVTARLRLRPIGMDVLQDLVASGDLDPALLSQMPTFSLSAQLQWTPADGFMKTIAAEATTDCGSYRCLLNPDDSGCH